MSVTVGDRELPVARGAAAGVGAYLVGYLVTYVLQSANARDMLEGINAIVQFFGGEPIPAWKAVGWLFYNAHGVAVTHPALGGGRTSRNFIASGDAPALLYALPLVVVVVVAAALAYGADADDPAAGGLVGTTVTLGYLPLALVGVLFFRATREGATIEIEPVTGVLLAGLVYPIVVGAVGGVFGSAFADSSGGDGL